MNRKIPFHELASLLAANCNISSAQAEDFIKSFFEQLTQVLTDGDTVRIKGIGTFAPTGVTDNPVEFTPDTELADTVNAPFAMFEPEVLSDTLTDEAITAVGTDTVDASAPEVAPTPAHAVEATTEQEHNDVEVAATEDTGDVESKEEQQNEIQQPPVSIDKPEPIVAPAKPEPVDATTKPEPMDTPVDTETTENSVEEHKTESSRTAATLATAAPVATTAKPASTPAATTPEVAPAPAVAATRNEFPEEEPEEYYQEPEQKSGAGFGWGFVIGLLVGMSIGAAAVYFAIDYIFPTTPVELGEPIETTDPLADILPVEVLSETAVDTPDSVDTPEAQSAANNVQPEATGAAGSVAAATTAAVTTTAQTETPKATETPAPKVVTDVVRAGYLLPSMAKKHYGNKCFWVYIYEENKAKIANPNVVNPGLKVVIPAAEKYGIDAKNPASVKAANEKIGKVLAKYPR